MLSNSHICVIVNMKALRSQLFDMHTHFHRGAQMHRSSQVHGNNDWKYISRTSIVSPHTSSLPEAGVGAGTLGHSRARWGWGGGLSCEGGGLDLSVSIQTDP